MGPLVYRLARHLTEQDHLVRNVLASFDVSALNSRCVGENAALGWLVRRYVAVLESPSLYFFTIFPDPFEKPLFADLGERFIVLVNQGICENLELDHVVWHFVKSIRVDDLLLESPSSKESKPGFNSFLYPWLVDDALILELNEILSCLVSSCGKES